LSGGGVDRPPPSRADVKERVEHLYFPYWPSWPVKGLNLPLRCMELEPNDAGTFRFHISESCLHVSGRIHRRGFGPSLSLSLPAQHNTNREKE
jgi:hypothetical protein